MMRQSGARGRQTSWPWARAVLLLPVVALLCAAGFAQDVEPEAQPALDVGATVAALLGDDDEAARAAMLGLIEWGTDETEANGELRLAIREAVGAAHAQWQGLALLRAARVLHYLDQPVPSKALREHEGVGRLRSAEPPADAAPLLAAAAVGDLSGLDVGRATEEQARAVAKSASAYLADWARAIDRLGREGSELAALALVALAHDPGFPAALRAHALVWRAEIARKPFARDELAWRASGGRGLYRDVSTWLMLDGIRRPGEPTSPTLRLLSLAALARFEPARATSHALRWTLDGNARHRRVAWQFLGRGPAGLALSFWLRALARETDLAVREALYAALPRAVQLPLDARALDELLARLVRAIPSERARAGTAAATALGRERLDVAATIDAVARTLAAMGAGYGVLADDDVPVEARAALSDAFWIDGARAEPGRIADIVRRTLALPAPGPAWRLVTRGQAALVAAGAAAAVLARIPLPAPRSRGARDGDDDAEPDAFVRAAQRRVRAVPRYARDRDRVRRAVPRHRRVARARRYPRRVRLRRAGGTGRGVRPARRGDCREPTVHA